MSHVLEFQKFEVHGTGTNTEKLPSLLPTQKLVP